MKDLRDLTKEIVGNIVTIQLNKIPKFQLIYHSRRRRREDEAAGVANQKRTCQIGKLSHNSPIRFSISSEVLILPVKFLSFVPAFQRISENIFGEKWRALAEAQQVKSFRCSVAIDIRERCFLNRALPAPVLPTYHQGNGGNCPVPPAPLTIPFQRHI